jgi:hypothetical protein
VFIPKIYRFVAFELGLYQKVVNSIFKDRGLALDKKADEFHSESRVRVFSQYK